MPFARSTLLALSLAAAQVYGHGFVQNIEINGKKFDGYDPGVNQFKTPEPETIGWSVPKQMDRGFVSRAASTDADIICHKSATNAPISATVKPGDIVTFLWTDWPESHKGPVHDAWARCDGPCSKAKKEDLKFFMIGEGGAIDTNKKEYAADILRKNNNSWKVEVPADLAPGEYVWRTEIIAYHSAGDPQFYPQCINIKYESSGKEKPTGIAATEFFADKKGLDFNIWNPSGNFDIPGPKLYSSKNYSAMNLKGSKLKKRRIPRRDTEVNPEEELLAMGQ